MRAEFDLDGRVAVVTGGGRGLGRAIAAGLAAHGARLVLAGRTRETLEAAAAELGAETECVAADVSREADVTALRDAAIARFGRVDVLVNNAGVNPIFKGIERTTLAEWDHIVGTNLTGVFLCCKHIGSAMAEQGEGSVINVSSVAGHVGLRRSVPYNAAKGGVELLTKALALDWATKGVRVNCLAPGYFETDLTAGLRENEALSAGLLAQVPQGRYGTDRDLVGAAVFLASPASAYVTGQSLLVDGGWTAQ
ncbi:MAG: glucose 1-dehydrogenase [Acetobacteraceae bacterium]|nr:glucose 1-dehydrogenase [Acetobacteraceae bacterium]